MPVTKSAKKALKQSRKKAAVNKPVRTRVKSVIANVRKLPTVENLKKAYSVLDRAAKKKVIKKGKVNRLKSRLTKLVNQTLKEKAAPKKSVKKTKNKARKKA